MVDGPWLYYKLTNEPKGSGELKILSFGIDRFEQTVQTKIRLKEQSDQGLHCLPSFSIF